jgi:hypothetical protein
MPTSQYASETSGCATRYPEVTKTHCAREFFLEEDADWMGAPSSPIEPRDTICLPNRFVAASLGSRGILEVDGELLRSSVNQECAD